MLFACGSFRSGLGTVGHDGHPCCGASAGPFNRAPRPLALKYIDADFLGDPVHHRAAFLGEFVAERHEFFRRLADGFRVRSGAVAERAQLNVLGRELVPQRRVLSANSFMMASYCAFFSCVSAW